MLVGSVGCDTTQVDRSETRASPGFSGDWLCAFRESLAQRGDYQLIRLPARHVQRCVVRPDTAPAYGWLSRLAHLRNQVVKRTVSVLGPALGVL